MNIPHDHHRWKKSSFSGTDGDCVEIAPWGGVRDSKNPTGPTLKVNLAQFVEAIKQR